MIIIAQSKNKCMLEADKKKKVKFNTTKFNIKSYIEIMKGGVKPFWKIEGADSKRIYGLGFYKTKKRANDIYREILRLINTMDEDYIYQMPEE